MTMNLRKIFNNTLIFYQSGISDIVNIAAMSITGFLATTALYKSYKNKLLHITEFYNFFKFMNSL